MVSKVTKRRLIALFAVCVIIAIFLAVGLGLGLTDDDDDDDSDSGANSGGTITTTTTTTKAPLTRDDEITVVVMLDGFMPRYLDDGIAPNLKQIATNGVRGMMTPAYPSVTFPNFISIFTGLYPESHKIVGNRFYDPVLNDTFGLNILDSLNPKWMTDSGIPIWIVAQNQNISSGMSNWASSQNVLPKFYRPLDPTSNYTSRIDTAIGWLNLSRSERPRFVGIYFEQPDGVSHFAGPNSATTRGMVTTMDNAFKYLLDKLDEINIRNITNIIVLSDHGMAEVNCAVRGIDLQTMANYAGAVIITSTDLATVYTQSPDLKNELLKNLTCQKAPLYAYDKSSNLMPIRLHYQNSRRIGDIVLVPRQDYLLANNISTCPRYLGDHGFDNIQPNMQATFIANGPAFTEGLTGAHFPNIELFNLFSDLLGITPTQNNGTYGSLHFIMKPEYRKSFSLSQKYSFQNRSFPDNFASAISSCSNCQCSDCNSTILSNIETYQKSLNLSTTEVSESQEKHFPWWLPMSSNQNDDVIVLTQKDFVVGYSKSLKIPMWEGHTLTKSSLSGTEYTATCFHKDIRLSANESSTCEQYQQSGFQRQPLAPMGDFRGDVTSVVNTNLLSNIVPMYKNFADMNAPSISSTLTGAWIKLEEWVRSREFTDLYIITGSIFDMNRDGLADSHEQQKNWLNNDNSTVAIATHYYKVIIKCATSSTIQQCASNLDILAFVLPHTNDTLCSLHKMQDYLGQHVARLRDVELLTGLHFLASLPAADQAKLKVQQHRMDEWPEQSNNQVA